MANEDQIKIIKQGVEVWNNWRKSNPSIIPDLTEADLRGLKLQKIDLHQAVLKSAKLQFTNFYGEMRFCSFKIDDSILKHFI